MVMLVILRLTIGWHFFYEGVWKIHADKFSAEPFLTQAKGPAAGLFHGMVPDLEGHERLKLTPVDEKKPDGPVTSEVYATDWDNLKQQHIDRYKPSEEQAKEVEALWTVYNKSLSAYLTANQDDIESYFEALERLKQRRAESTNGTTEAKKRLWDTQQALRGEVRGWIAELDAMSEEYRLALWDILDDDQKRLGMIEPESDFGDFLNFAVTYGLTAIGLCLMLGFCTRLAALGGAAFLFSVVLSQLSWPTIYPPAPEVVGHSLLVDKNFVEMIATLVLVTIPVGRWCGLDFFLHHLFGRRLECFFSKKVD